MNCWGSLVLQGKLNNLEGSEISSSASSCARSEKAELTRRQAISEGGEALPKSRVPQLAQSPAFCPKGAPPWHALYTRSHCEQQVYDALNRKAFDLFLPKAEVWSRGRGKRHKIQVPLFPSYLFLRGVIDKASYIEVIRTPGVVRLLGESWGRLAVVPEEDILAVQRMLRSGEPVHPFPYPKVGERVRVRKGSIEGIEGVLVEVDLQQSMFVVTIELLQQGVAIRIDPRLVERCY